MKKTKNLCYDELRCQEYLTTMSPADAQIIFRARMGCIKCKKGNMASGYRSDMKCRLCGDCEETQEHVINCSLVRGDKDILDIGIVRDIPSTNTDDLVELCSRVRLFDDLVSKAS